MSEDDATGFARRNVRFFRSLAVILALGVVFALVLAFGGVTGPGYFALDAAVTAALVAVFVITAVLALFLLRIGVIFDVERHVKDLFDAESARLERTRLDETEEARGFRNSIHQELAKIRDTFGGEQSQWNARIKEAVSAGQAATAQAREVGQKVDALAREPTYRSAIESLQTAVTQLQKDLAGMHSRDPIDSPLLKELQANVVGLQKSQAQLAQVVDEALENVERREMEQAAVRQGLEKEVADLRKRESLLMVKTRELEDSAANPRTQTLVQLTPAEEKQHVLKIEGIGERYASRLNQIGIISIPRLLDADAEQIGPAIGAMPELVREWQSMGILMRLKGVGNQSAELLVRGGIRSVEHLAAQDAEQLASQLRELEKGRKTRIQGGEVSSGVVKRWIQAARDGTFDTP